VKLDMHAQRDFAFTRLVRPFDVGFGNLVGVHSDLTIVPLARAPIVAVLPNEHALARRRTIRPRDLDAVPAIRLPPDTAIGAAVATAMGPRAGPAPAFEASHTHVALRMAGEGIGVHVTDALAAADSLSLPVRIVPLAGAPAVVVSAFAPMRGDLSRSAEIAELCRAVFAMLRELGAEFLPGAAACVAKLGAA
jgi:DNA-binding transcriptional LysR family regulator